MVCWFGPAHRILDVCIFSTPTATQYGAAREYDGYIDHCELHKNWARIMKLNSAAPEQGNSFELIEIRRIKSDFVSNTDYLKFRNKLAGKAINPWLKNWAEETATLDYGAGWAAALGYLEPNEVAKMTVRNRMQRGRRILRMATACSRPQAVTHDTRLIQSQLLLYCRNGNEQEWIARI